MCALYPFPRGCSVRWTRGRPRPPSRGPVFRAINKAGRVWGDGVSPKVLWDVVRIAAARAGIDKLAPHDLRRTCARLCRLAGGELDQIQFLLGHVSIQRRSATSDASRSSGLP